ncbi:MAG: DNA polymerase IV [Spirochaetes bacterium]|nr:DNA polymerase IV [Spirochaetota bacterium]
MTRKIIHIDMDAFYASIEQRDNPALRGRPVVVGGSPEKRGVVSAASYEARKFGIHSAMPTKRAVALCRNLTVIRPDFIKYKDVSGKLYSFYSEYTDLIEPLALDEAYLDVTKNKKNISTATEIAVRLKEKIRNELSLTASAGVAPNKLIAKIASDWKKPDGLFVVKPHQVQDFVKNLDIRKIWGVGKVTERKLLSMGISKCSDLYIYDKNEITDLFGKLGEVLFYFSRGIDDRPVVSHRKAKSAGAEITFETDYSDMEIIKSALFKQAERVSGKLKMENLAGKTVTLKVKYSDFTQITRSMSVSNSTNNLNEIYLICEKLLIEKTEAGVRRIRLIGLSVGNFDENENSQELFDS